MVDEKKDYVISHGPADKRSLEATPNEESTYFLRFTIGSGAFR